MEFSITPFRFSTLALTPENSQFINVHALKQHIFNYNNIHWLFTWFITVF